MRTFQYCCVAPKDEEELNYIIDNMTDITYQTFVKNIDKEFFYKWCIDTGYGKELKIKDDWSVSYHKCKLKNKNKIAYICCWSGIEHVYY